MKLVNIINRLGWALLTYITVNLFIFFVPRLMPGNYIDYIASSRFLPEEAVKELYVKFGLNEPLYAQFLKFLLSIMFSPRPDFGYSYVFYPQKAWDVVMIYLPWTLLLLSVATVATFLFGLFMGFIAALKKDSLLDRFITSFSIFTMSNPYFVIAMFLLIIFSLYLRAFPPGGAYSPTPQADMIHKILDIMWHMILPVIAITIGTSGQYVIMTRSIIVNNMREDYFRSAEAIGIRRSKILIDYALKPGVLPLITLFGIRFGTMLSGALLTEIIFSYPGLGYLLYQAILSKDFPVIQAIFYMICVMVIATSLILDITYSLLDPRIREG